MSGPFGSAQLMYNPGFYPELIDQSLRFDSSAHLYRTATSGNSRTFTWSSWVKVSTIASNSNLLEAAATSGNPYTSIWIDGNAQLSCYIGSNGGTVLKASPKLRDPSAWYHIVFAFDTTQADNSNRIKFYINGLEPTYTTRLTITQNLQVAINTAGSRHDMGAGIGGNYDLDGYLADTYFIDGTALDPTSFGEFKSGVWIPKAYTGSYGTNGFHLTYQDDTVSEGFNTVTYTGNGGTQSITGVGFQPDLVWVKGRNETYYHRLTSIGLTQPNYLATNATDAESSGNNTISSLDSNGFTVDATGTGGTNESAINYVAWCWDAGDSTVSNTDGSITSSVRANPAYGFSIVSYTGTGAVGTVGHGLGAAPDVVIVKSSSHIIKWGVYHASLGNTKMAYLNETSVAGTSSVYWNNTTPSSSVFTIGNGDEVGINGVTYIAYCFSEIAGYSKFGSYTGTSAAGNVVTTGFPVAFVMIKNTDAASSWAIFDNTRNTFPPQTQMLRANTSGAEETKTDREPTFTSTGFTIGDADVDTNATNNTYIYMAFADTRDLAFWRDQSGNGNDWQPTNLNYQDTVFDSPTNNYATLNPLAPSGGTFSNGNLSWSSATTDGRFALSTISPSTDGKWYCEVNIGSKASTYWTVGLFAYPATALPRILYRSDGVIYLDGSEVATVSSFTQNDVIGMAYDGSTRSLTLYKNNTSLGSWTASSTTINYFFGCASDSSGSSANYTLNFGQSGFTYTPPDGFLALSTANLPEPSISPLYGASPQDHFNTVTYTGTGANQTINTSNKPELVWIKNRASAFNHNVTDIVRGPSKRLVPSGTFAEQDLGTEGVVAFNNSSFEVGPNDPNYNETGSSLVAWVWKANGSGVSNTAGSITSQVSANPTAGFSIVSYTGTGAAATVGHGLGAAPKMVIYKIRSAVDGWGVYHAALGNTQALLLESTTAAITSSTYWNSTSPTSAVLSLGTWSRVNANTATFIAYCFADVEGYSKFGSYTGNGSSDGPFVYTGFRPAWVMVKQSSAAGENWEMWDSSRGAYNLNTPLVYANLSNAEGGNNARYDVLSNGLKLKSVNAGVNASGATYIYMAFAENPFKYANAR